jgi:TonB-dependent receptor
VTTGSDGVPQLARGNPDLEAREADNFDASLEYYFPNDQGLVSVAVFNKDITNEIFRFQDDETINGVVTRVTQPRNVAEANLRGIELSYIQNNLGQWVQVLDGVGFSTNFSYFEGESDVVGNAGIVLRKVDQLLQQPETVFNASVFYNRGPVETRLTYARSSAFPSAISSTATASTDRYDEPYFQLDWTGRYDLTDHIQLTGEVRNLTNERKNNVQTTDLGDYSRDFNLYGRTLFVGVAYKY